MQFIYSQEFTAHLKTELQSFFSDDDCKRKAIVYSNSRVSVERLKDNLDSWHDQNGYFEGDIITIVGSLFTEQKFERANLFVEDIDVAAAIDEGKPCPRLLLATGGTIGAGYDNPFVQAVFRHGFPLSLANKRQEDGRNRGEGIALMVSSLSNYVYLLKRMYRRELKEDQQIRTDMTHVVSIDEQRSLQRAQLLDVVRMVVLDLGCWHVLLEMATGNPETGDDFELPDNCGTQCPRCRGEFEPRPSNHYRQIDRDGIIAFLVDTFINNPVGKVTPDELVKLLFNSNPGQSVYKRPRSTKAHSNLSCEFTIFQLIAARIIDIMVEEGEPEFDSRGKMMKMNEPKIWCKLCTDASHNMAYSVDSNWGGILTY